MPRKTRAAARGARLDGSGSSDGAEQPVRLAVDPVGKVKDIGTAVLAADPEIESPKAARHAAIVDRDGALQRSGQRIKGVYLVQVIARLEDRLTSIDADNSRRDRV
jgi:hypothetical protein